MRHQLAIAALAWLACSGSSLAQSTAMRSASAAPPQPETSAPTEPAASGAVPLLTDADLATLRAGEDVTVSVVSNQQLTALTANNTVTADVLNSGPISFNPDALANFSGIGNFVMNTGANNSLQGAINITIMASPVIP